MEGMCELSCSVIRRVPVWLRLKVAWMFFDSSGFLWWRRWWARLEAVTAVTAISWSRRVAVPVHFGVFARRAAMASRIGVVGVWFSASRIDAAWSGKADW